MRRLTTCRASRRAPSMSSVSMDASSTMTVPKPVGGVEAFDFAVDAGEVARLANIPRHRGMGHFDEAGGDGELLFGAQVFKGAEGFISPLLWCKVLHNVVGLVEFFLAVTVGVLTLLEPLRFQLGLGVLVGGAQAQVVLLIALGPLAKEFLDRKSTRL